MPYEFEHNEADNWLKFRLFGVVQPEDLRDLASSVLAALKEHQCKRLLTDVRDVHHQLSTADIYNMPQLTSELGYPVDTRIACVYGRDAADFRFYEDVSVNRGQLVRVFTDIDEALAWLKQEDGS